MDFELRSQGKGSKAHQLKIIFVGTVKSSFNPCIGIYFDTPVIQVVIGLPIIAHLCQRSIYFKVTRPFLPGI
jgi:hypothetical protein